MTLIKINGASAANGYSGASNQIPPEEIARRAAAQAHAARGGGPLAPMINPELLGGAGAMQRIHAEQRADALMRNAAINQQRVGDIAGGADLSKIDWPEQPYYGWDHARDTSQLAVHIAQGMDGSAVWNGAKLDAKDIEVVKAAALFHDLGRTEDWRVAAPGHRHASAEAARQLMREDSAAWFRRDLIDDVCRLITQHVMPRVDGDGNFRDDRGDIVVPTLPTDPRLQCLWDAEAFEGMRFSPGTWEGSVVLKARLAHLCTPWAKLTEHQRRWRERKGWT